MKRLNAVLVTVALVGLTIDQISARPSDDQCHTPALKIDCHPEDNASKEACESRRCCWVPVTEDDPNRNYTEVPVSTPWCFYPSNYVGYEPINTMSKTNEIKLKRTMPSGFPSDIQKVSVKVSCKGHLFRIRVVDNEHQRYEPQLPVQDLPNEMSEDCEFSVKNNNNKLTVTRKDSGVVVFNAELSKLVFADQFIQITTTLDSPFVYGLGEHFDTFLKKADKWRTYSMLNYDQHPQAGLRSYSGFPFYINFDSEMSKAHGVYLRNSNGMDVIIHPEPQQAVTFRTIGGILDFILFAGPTPMDVIVQYQHSVGLPAIPPRWSLGFHLCRYGYKTLEKTRTVWSRTREAGIPFDVQWNDIDYMERYNDFTYDHGAYKGLPEFVKNDLHANEMKYIILFDPGVSQEDDYEPYLLGENMNIFVKTQNGTTLVGKVWNSSGRTVFPDFSNPKSHDYWAQLFVKFHQELEYDGAWIDMNDISSFVDGSLDGCPQNNTLESPPYRPGGMALAQHTLCMSAQHMMGPEYNLHNLYSFYEAIATYKALELARPQTRPFIISRSTYPGQGKYSGHWDGDILSDWANLKWTVPSIIEHSMYGFQMMGGDICGFTGNTNVELCARWHTLGSFYTFTRNHNDDVSIDQDPVALGPVVVQAARDSLLKRYTMLPYLYSLMFRGHLLGEPSVRSVAFEYFRDPQALAVEDQFLWGSGFMVSPIVTPNTYEKSTYLPAGVWYETNLNLTADPKRIELESGQWHSTSNVALTDIPLFYRGGHAIPVYEKPGTTVAQTIRQPFSWEVYLCEKERAHGELYDDDGENLDGSYNHITFDVKDNTLTIKMDKNAFSESTEFESVKVFGVKKQVSEVTVNGRPMTYSQNSQILRFKINSQVTTDEPIVVEWKFS